MFRHAKVNRSWASAELCSTSKKLGVRFVLVKSKLGVRCVLVKSKLGVRCVLVKSKLGTEECSG